MKLTHNSLLKSSLLNSLPCMIYSPNRIQRTRRFHTVFFSVPSVPFVIPWCSTRDSRLAAKPIIDAAQDSRKLLRFQRLSLTSCPSPACPKFEPLPKRFFSIVRNAQYTYPLFGKAKNHFKETKICSLSSARIQGWQREYQPGHLQPS